MDYDDYDNRNAQERQGDDVYSKPVRAGKRTYFFDVKATKGNDYYLTITESKRRIEENGRYVYDKHKIFLYKEDFDKFSEGLQEVVDYIRQRCPVPDQNGPAAVAEEESEPVHGDAPADDGKYSSDVKFDEL
jgi:hypothetical protein